MTLRADVARLRQALARVAPPSPYDLARLPDDDAAELLRLDGKLAAGGLAALTDRELCAYEWLRAVATGEDATYPEGWTCDCGRARGLRW